MHGVLKFKLGVCGFFVIIMAGILSDITIATKALGESQMTMRTSGRDSKNLLEREKQLSSKFLDKVQLLNSYGQRKQALVKKYINLSLKLEKMQVILQGLQSADIALSVDSKENTLMLEHRKIVLEKQFVFERILEGLFRQYQLLENLETLRQRAVSKAIAPSDNREEIRWVKGELRRLEEMENWNWMMLKIKEALHYLRTDITNELNLLRRK
ncbi:MAG: hypothetical protein O7F12_02700 [Nitrospirae bacterium]|nr:hypothetical protein [Nitrospirota bacterium]